jgi:hypothetical protein
MSRALQFTQEFLDRKLVGLRHIFERAEARQVAAYAGGFAVNEDPG